MPEDKEKTQQAEPKKSSSAIKYLIIALIFIIIIPSVGFFAASKFIFKKAEEKKEESDSTKMGIIYPIDAIIVNIANTQATRYLRAGISFEIPDESLTAELNERKPQITDLLIMILSSKEMEDLMDFSGKNQIRKEIMEKVNSKLATGKLRNVYFTEFVVQ